METSLEISPALAQTEAKQCNGNPASLTGPPLEEQPAGGNYFQPSTFNPQPTFPHHPQPSAKMSAQNEPDGFDNPPPPAGRSAAEPFTPRDEWRVAEANRRLPLVELYRALLASEVSPKDAARQIGASRSSLDRWNRRFEKLGFNGLLPLTEKCGRKSVLHKLKQQLGEEIVNDVLKKARATALDAGSAVTGFRLTAKAGNAPEAIAQLADYAHHGGRRSSKHALPPSIRDEVRVDKMQHLAHEGRRALALRGFWIPRRVDVLPGDVWTSDDTTPIWGWWVPWPHALGNPVYKKDSCEYRFGVKLLQGQLLPLMDVASNCIFTFALIARETSAYRASDIWGLFGRAFSEFGLPRLGFQLERGSWEANLIRGVEVEVRDSELSWNRRVGGLRMLPTNVTTWHHEKLGADFAFPKTLQTWTSFLPKSKPIEAAFDRMQTLEGTLWGNLGRDQMRRPNEKAKKQFQSCQRGAADPREHFLEAGELVQRLTAILHYLNDEPMEGQVFHGVPRLLWEQALREHPLLYLDQEQHYLFRRSWHVTRVTSGWARAKFKDIEGRARTEHYCHPECFASPGMEGRSIILYFDDEQYQQPAQIHDAETGEFICAAEWFERPGMFLDTSAHGHELKRRYNQAVTTHYADLARRAPSRQLPPEIAARRAAEPVEVQQRAPAAAPVQPRGYLTARPSAEEQRRGRNNLAVLAQRSRELAARAEI